MAAAIRGVEHERKRTGAGQDTANESHPMVVSSTAGNQLS
jgi:hypothetical protein